MSLGKTVRVWTRLETGRDSMGEPVWEWASHDVSNVLVKPLTGQELSKGDTASDVRPDGVNVRFRLAFPKTYNGPSLRHAKISLIDAPWLQDADNVSAAYVVVDDPQPEDPCPTQWNMLCEIGKTDG